MSMPDRSATVRAFYAAHPEVFTVERHDENRRRSLPALIAHLEAIHPEDRGQWGVLVKTDRALKIPCDVLVWRPTLEHVDVVTGTGGMWGAHGPIHVNAGGHGIWFWAPASVVDPTGEERALRPPPYDAPPAGAEGGPPGPAPGADADLRLEISRLRAEVGALTATQGMLVGLLERVLTRPDPVVTVPPAPPVVFPAYVGTLPLPGILGGAREIVFHPTKKG